MQETKKQFILLAYVYFSWMSLLAKTKHACQTSHENMHLLTCYAIGNAFAMKGQIAAEFNADGTSNVMFDELASPKGLWWVSWHVMRVRPAMKICIYWHVTQLGMLSWWKARLLPNLMLTGLRTWGSTSWLHQKVSDESLGKDEICVSNQPWDYIFILSKVLHIFLRIY